MTSGATILQRVCHVPRYTGLHVTLMAHLTAIHVAATELGSVYLWLF